MRFEFGEFELDDKRFTIAGPAGPFHVEPRQQLDQAVMNAMARGRSRSAAQALVEYGITPS